MGRPVFLLHTGISSKRKIQSSSSLRRGYLRRDEKLQLPHRCAPPLIRHVFAEFRSGTLNAAEARQQLGLSKSRFYDLYADYLRACALHKQDQWLAGTSGGDHAPVWPEALIALLRKRLSSRPPASYSFAASEAARLLSIKIHRAQVRRWALENGLAQSNPRLKAKAPVRRWQRAAIGELWQLDATPHPWFANSRSQWPMLNMLDDCSRLFTASRIYERETLLSYFDLLPRAFADFGLPLALYVDYHSIFFTSTPEAVTQLGWALRFYGVTLRYAPTPQAKGKVERAHQYWQKRLPAHFASEQIAGLEEANAEIDKLRAHRNAQETHRELGMTAQSAWNRALQEKRTKLRKAPDCPWWPYVWAQRATIKVGSDGRVPIGSDRLSIEAIPGSKVIHCTHPTGHFSVLLKEPNPSTTPCVLFTNRG
ncbi:MAG: hypothetical protein M3Q12_13585 [Pseudomonadota bacterium]|nr:hypothetical protein [Pseudomonadota bacterium]